MFNYKTRLVRLEKQLTTKERFDKWVNKHYFTLLIILLISPSATESGMLRNYLIRGI